MARRAKLTLLALAFTPLCAPFASTPEPYEAPEGQILIRDSYQFLGAGQPVFEAITGPGGGPYLLTAAEVRWLPVCRPVRWLRALAAHVHQNPPSPRWTSGRADRRTAYAEFTQDGRGSQLRCALQPKTCNV